MIFLKSNREKGFLLIDALVAMLILLIALISIVGLITSTNKLTGTNEDLTRANKLAQFSMEKLKQVQPSAWKELILTSDTNYKTLVSPIESISLIPPVDPKDPDFFKKFTCVNSARIISPGNTTGTHLVEVRSQVTWTSTLQSGAAKTNTVVLVGYCERQENK